MIINIRDYVDRWMNDYIVYHTSHLQQYGDIDRAGLYFNLKYQEQISKMNSGSMQAQAEVILRTMKARGQKIPEGLNLVDALANGNLLEFIFDLIAEEMNQGIEKYYNSIGFDNFESITEEAINLASQGLSSKVQIDRFFELIMQGISQAASFDKELLVGLTDIGQRLSGNKSFNLDKWSKKTKAKRVSQEDINMCRTIVSTLSSAVDALQSSGVNGTQNFARIVAKIFTETIGDKAAKNLIKKSLEIITSTADSAFDRATQTSNGALTWLNRGRQNLGSSRGAKAVDIFNQRTFLLRAKESGLGIDIELGTNLNVAWNAGSADSDDIHLIANATMGDFYKNGTTERYLAYNMIAHSNQGTDFGEAYEAVKTSTAASFFNEYVLGGGAIISQRSMYLDKAQFLLINGRLYSVMHIIKNICEEAAQNNDIFRMDLDFVQNRWIGSAPSIYDAMARSQLVNSVIDKMSIGINLNSNILLKYT